MTEQQNTSTKKFILRGDPKIALSIMEKGFKLGLEPQDWTVEGNYADRYLELTFKSEVGYKYLKRIITRMKKNKNFYISGNTKDGIVFEEYEQI